MGWWMVVAFLGVLFCKFPAVFLKGKASPPFFLRFEREHWTSISDQKRVEQVSNTLTHPIFVLRCPVVKGASDLTKAKLVAGHLANRHLTFVTASFALTNAHVEDKMSRNV